MAILAFLRDLMKMRTPAPPRAFRQLLVGLALCMGATWAAPATAQNLSSVPESIVDASLVRVTGVAKHELMRSIASKEHAYKPFGLAPCAIESIESIACSSTTDKQLDTDCTQDGHPVDVLSFAGTAGQQVTIRLTFSAFDAFVVIYGPSQNVAYDGGADSLLVFTLNETGTWYILVGSIAGETGAYTLTLECSGVGSCVPNSTTLCLNNGRFQVTAAFLTPQGQSGIGHAIPATSDTGLFWFFSANNIEAIVKVVNGCDFDLNHRYWVFAAGLTNVQVALTVTDTSNGETRTYTNPQGTPFAPIQDTDAFANCP